MVCFSSMFSSASLLLPLIKLTLVHPGKPAPVGGDAGEQREPPPHDAGRWRWVHHWTGEVGSRSRSRGPLTLPRPEHVSRSWGVIVLLLCHPGLGWMSPAAPGCGILCHSDLQGRREAPGGNTLQPPHCGFTLKASLSCPRPWVRLPLIKVALELLPSNCFRGSINFHIHNTTEIYRATEQKASVAFHFLA